MGNADTKGQLKDAIESLTSTTQAVDPNDDVYWCKFWSESSIGCASDVFNLVTAADIRSLRETVPGNLGTLIYKTVERLASAADTSVATQAEQTEVLNCVRLLTRLLPYVFEDSDWRSFFWSSGDPRRRNLSQSSTDAARGASPSNEKTVTPLAFSLLSALSDLLFCPDLTVASGGKKSAPDRHEDLHSIDSCEFIWEGGVGFSGAPHRNPSHDANRTEILKLLLTCFSETMYFSPVDEKSTRPNEWIGFFTSSSNRHALPLFTSLLNVVLGFTPSGIMPYNHLIWSDPRETLVEAAIQTLIVTLDHDSSSHPHLAPSEADADEDSSSGPENLFVNYLSRIHREEDFTFMLRGFTRLLNNPLNQSYLPNSTKKIQCHQEVLVCFWKCCEYNRKFLYFVLKSSEVLDILVPILYHLNDARADQSRVGLMHIGVFILLLLSGERNFGVRLNKPYTAAVPMDIPVFTGTHADLLIIVFHKIITTGHQRLQPLFDCLLTILVNVSPYLKTLSMVASTKLLHLLEAFSTPWFLFSSPNNHHLVFFLLEVFNNLIQYQFDGNSNLVYTIIRKRNVFHQLSNLPLDGPSIQKSLKRRSPSMASIPSSKNSPKPSISGTSPSSQPGSAPGTPQGDHSARTIPDPSNGSQASLVMEGSRPAMPAEPGTLKATLAATPMLENMTEQESAHPPNPTGASSRTPSPGGEEESSNGPDFHDPSAWAPTADWVASWKNKLPLQTIMRLLQVLVPQVEKICIDKGLTDESEILRFLQHGTLVGLLPVPHPILIRKYQANSGTTNWFRTYIWGVIYLRNVDPPIWYDTLVRLFEIQRV